MEKHLALAVLIAITLLIKPALAQHDD